MQGRTQEFAWGGGRPRLFPSSPFQSPFPPLSHPLPLEAAPLKQLGGLGRAPTEYAFDLVHSKAARIKPLACMCRDVIIVISATMFSSKINKDNLRLVLAVLQLPKFQSQCIQSWVDLFCLCRLIYTISALIVTPCDCHECKMCLKRQTDDGVAAYVLHKSDIISNVGTMLQRFIYQSFFTNTLVDHAYICILYIQKYTNRKTRSKKPIQ